MISLMVSVDVKHHVYLLTLGSLQLVVHFTDTGGLLMAVDHPVCRPSLHSLNFADVLGGVQVTLPDTANIFHNWVDKCFVHLFFGSLDWIFSVLGKKPRQGSCWFC